MLTGAQRIKMIQNKTTAASSGFTTMGRSFVPSAGARTLEQPPYAGVGNAELRKSSLDLNVLQKSSTKPAIAQPNRPSDENDFEPAYSFIN